MSYQTLLNQAIATIKGTLTNDGLLVDSTLIKTRFSRSYYRYVEKHPVTLPYDSLFRAWPRTDKTGTLTGVTITAINAPVTEAIFAGQVIWSSDTLVTIRVSPTRKQIKPFLLTLLHDGSARLEYGWSMQFICEFSDEDSKFHVKEVISLKHLVFPSDMTSDDTPATPAVLECLTKELVVV